MTNFPPTDANMPCLLPALATPSLHDLLPGLFFAEGEVHLNATDWPCCEGTGQVDLADTSLHMCSLTRRLASVRLLYQRYLERWGHPQRLEPPKVRSQAGEMAHALFQIAQKAQSRGLVLPVPNEGAGPSGLWRVAMGAAFRFGLRPQIVTLGKTPVDQLYPVRTEDKAPLVLFVEQVDRLWDGDYREEFEACISYAYKAQAPLFMELVHRQTRPAAAVPFGKSPSSLMDKVQLLKTKDPIGWLPSDMREKLRSVSEVETEAVKVPPLPTRSAPPPTQFN